MICGGVYLVETPIKHGSFGAIYKGKNIITHEPVAIKTDYNTDMNLSLIHHEATILQYLATQSQNKITCVLNYGKLSDGSYYLVMPYYQMSLADLMADTNSKITSEQAKCYFSTMVNTLKYIHDKGVIHRDIKPANFMFNIRDRIVLIDFGLATYYLDSCKNHIKNRPMTDIIGSRRYVSINVQSGNTPSRRDDLISVAYILVALCWPEHIYQTNNTSSSYNWHEIKQIKNMPEPVQPLMQYLYSLAFMERPDYEALCQEPTV